MDTCFSRCPPTSRRPVAQQTKTRAEILGCHIDRLTMSETVRECERFILNGHRAQHVSVNAAKLVTMRANPALREVILSFRRDEIAHRDLAIAEGAEEAPAYDLITAAVKTGSRIAIWLSSRWSSTRARTSTAASATVSRAETRTAAAT